MGVSQIYWELIPDTLIITTTEKVGYTSMTRAIKRSPRIPEWEIPDHPAKVRLYLRHPITRFASAWAYFTDSGYFPADNRIDSPRLAKFSIEHFTDKVLDERYWNRHWAPQIAQHKYFDEVYRFENINETWPHAWAYRELGQWNKSKTPKPAILYRLHDLQEYYQEDLRAWEKATK